MTLTLSLVNKHYGEKHALVDLSYEFTNGIYGLLGPNGAGKSTMMNIITQNLEYTTTVAESDTYSLPHTTARRHTIATTD